MPNRASVIFLVALTLAAMSPTTRADPWTMEAGTIITDNETTVILATDVTVNTSLVFAETGEWSIDTFGVDFTSGSNWTWNLTNWTPVSNVTFQGDGGAGGSVRFTGFPGYYNVTGLNNFPSFQVQGPTFTLNILPVAQAFSITPTSTATTGLRMSLSSYFNTPQETIASTVTVTDSSGNPITSAPITHAIYRPDGSLFDASLMVASPSAGVYTSNVSVPASEPAGPWLVVVTYGGTVASSTVIKEDSMISTAIDSYIPLIVWGTLLIILLVWNAWLPAVAALMNLANTQLPDPVWSFAASVMFIGITLVLHSMAVNGLIPVPWRKPQ